MISINCLRTKFAVRCFVLQKLAVGQLNQGLDFCAFRVIFFAKFQKVMLIGNGAKVILTNYLQAKFAVRCFVSQKLAVQ